jgi:hypothetical protein
MTANSKAVDETPDNPPASSDKQKSPKLSKTESKTEHDMAQYIALLEQNIEVLTAENDELASQERQIIVVPAEMPVINTKMNLKDLHVTMYPLAMPQTFADNDIQFSQIIIVSKREHTKEFEWAGQMLFLDDGACVEGQTAKCWFARIGWVKYGVMENIPMVFCVYSTKDVQDLLNIVIDATGLQSLREEILGRMILNLRNDFEKFQDLLETANDFREKAEKREELLRKKVRNDEERLDNNLEIQLERHENMFKLNLWQALALGSGWLGFLTCLGFLFGGG